MNTDRRRLDSITERIIGCAYMGANMLDPEAPCAPAARAESNRFALQTAPEKQNVPFTAAEEIPRREVCLSGVPE